MRAAVTLISRNVILSYPLPVGHSVAKKRTMCWWWLCCPSSDTKAHTEPLHDENYNDADYHDLEYIAQKRALQITIRMSTKAGLAAGLSVTAGTLMAGPPGALVGGVLGTMLATHMAKQTVPLTQLLKDTPTERRGQVLQLFRETFQDEFLQTVNGSPELKLLLSGGSIFGVVRYLADKELVSSERLDAVMKKIAL